MSANCNFTRILSLASFGMLDDTRRLPRPSPWEWASLAIGVALVLTYSWILDDAFVYFRYVDNLLFAHVGLVYNPGEYVEGFSSPAWAMLLIALRSTHLGYWAIVQGVAVLSYAWFWWLLVAARRRVSVLAGTTAPSVNLPLIYLSCAYGFLCYFSSGLEAPLVNLSAAIFWCLLLKPEHRGSQIAAGLMPLVRHELALALIVFVAWRILARRRIPWPAVISGALGLGGWVCFRIWYYADIFPLTFYLKDVMWLGQGVRYLWDTARTYYLAPLAALAIVVGFLTRSPATSRQLASARTVALIVAAAYTAYVVKIGGDARHFRYLAFPFCLGVVTMDGLVERALDAWPRRRRLVLAAVAAFAACLLATYPRQLRKHPLLAILNHDEGRATETVDLINDAQVHRQFIPLTPGTRAERRPPSTDFRPGFQPAEVIDDFNCRDNYLASDAWIIHSLGLTDPYLARTAMPFTRPAHKRGLRALAPDLVAVRRQFGTGAGAFRRAVEAGQAAPWIAANLDAFERIEAQTHNRHDFLENLSYVLQPPPVIDPSLVPAAKERLSKGPGGDTRRDAGVRR